MDQAIDKLLTLGTAFFAVSIVIITFFVRRFVETAAPGLKKKADEDDPRPSYGSMAARWWNKILIHLVPVVTGSTIAVLKVPFLIDLPGLENTSSLVFFGGVVGWFSSLFYKGVRLAIKNKTGVDISPTDSLRPGPDDIIG